jgi:trimethylamine:corrinoid methyltransferase-like protein
VIVQAELGLFAHGEVEEICAAARRILHRKGLRFTIPEALTVFRRHGFQVSDGDVVHISPQELEEALKTVPRSFVRRGAEAARDVFIGDGVTKYAVGSLPIWIVESSPGVGRRPATYRDFRDFTLLS